MAPKTSQEVEKTTPQAGIADLIAALSDAENPAKVLEGPDSGKYATAKESIAAVVEAAMPWAQRMLFRGKRHKVIGTIDAGVEVGMKGEYLYQKSVQLFHGGKWLGAKIAGLFV